MSVVFFRPGCGQQLKLPAQSEFGKIIAAACISLGGGCVCCLASLYGIANGTVEQRERLNEAVRDTLEELRSLAEARA